MRGRRWGSKDEEGGGGGGGVRMKRAEVGE